MAQRAMTRSSAEYRLAEREIAEGFCEVHHIPTRTEGDSYARYAGDWTNLSVIRERYGVEPSVVIAIYG